MAAFRIGAVAYPTRGFHKTFVLVTEGHLQDLLIGRIRLRKSYSGVARIDVSFCVWQRGASATYIFQSMPARCSALSVACHCPGSGRCDCRSWLIMTCCSRWCCCGCCCCCCACCCWCCCCCCAPIMLPKPWPFILKDVQDGTGKTIRTPKPAGCQSAGANDGVGVGDSGGASTGVGRVARYLEGYQLG